MKHLPLTLTAALAALALAGCSAAAPSPSAAKPSEKQTTVTVVSHESFNLSDSVKASFKAKTGYELKIVAQGDAGQLVNQLVLTKDSPLGDAVFGIDNTFAGRAINAGILTPYASPKLPKESSDLNVDASNALTPTDFGDVCVNADKAWFEAAKKELPKTLDDLTKPEYKDLLVVQNPASSSPGLAFLAATIGEKKADGYLDYWGKLKGNGVKVVKGWTEAYSTEYSAGEGKGKRPLVVSYSTSPASHVTKDGAASTTTALLNTCFRQVEYAGVLKGAKNEAGAKAFVDWMLSDEVQADIPGQMYMYPAVKSTKLPDEWVKFAPLAPTPLSVPADELGKNREAWIKAWTAAVVG